LGDLLLLNQYINTRPQYSLWPVVFGLLCSPFVNSDTDTNMTSMGITKPNIDCRNRGRFFDDFRPVSIPSYETTYLNH